MSMCDFKNGQANVNLNIDAFLHSAAADKKTILLQRRPFLKSAFIQILHFLAIFSSMQIFRDGILVNTIIAN